jgi:hypothetical protein
LRQRSALDEKKPASGAGCSLHWRLALDLVTVFGACGSLLDGFACDVGTADVETFFLAAVLGFVFVADTLGHVILL